MKVNAINANADSAYTMTFISLKRRKFIKNFDCFQELKLKLVSSGSVEKEPDHNGSNQPNQGNQNPNVACIILSFLIMQTIRSLKFQ
jgi:hypothetical protein